MQFLFLHQIWLWSSATTNVEILFIYNCMTKSTNLLWHLPCHNTALFYLR